MSREGMMRAARLLVLALLLGSMATAVFSQSPPPRSRDDLDVTMHVIVDPDAKVPDEIVRRIQLPKPSQAAPAEDKKSTGEKPEPGAKGQERAAEAREQGREFGQQVSEEAKQRSEEARRNQGKPPEKPNPPSPPGRPTTPPGH